MSSKAVKSAVSENKSKAKALLLMLEKVISGPNPDKEQTRFLCHKLLHLVNNHEAAKKEISSKTSLEVVISILETCGDQPTCLTLVNILSEIAAGNGIKRLINHDVTRVLLHTVAYLGKEADNRLLIALLNLSVKIAPKDRRFALRVRLAGALPVLVSIVRSSSSYSSSNKLLSSTLQCLKICASNGVNSSILGRIGAVHVFQKLILNVGRKQPSLVKTALSTLSLLVKSSRSNANHAISNGVITNMLAIHQEWHRNDYRSHKHIPARKSMLMILKHLTVSKRGKSTFVEVGGVRILHRTSKECATMSCPKAAEPLLTVATMVLRRCQPRFRLPIPTVQCSFKFQLPEVEDKTDIADNQMQGAAMVDDVIDMSDDDDDDEEVASDIQELENEELLEEEKKQEEEAKEVTTTAVPIIVPPITRGIPPKRAALDLKIMYERFFPEHWEFQTDDNDTSKYVWDIEETAFLQNNILRQHAKPPADSSQGRATADVCYGQSMHLSRARSEGNVLSIHGIPSSAFEPPPSAPAPSVHPGDEHSSLMAALASSTKTKKQTINTVSLADYFGHLPPAIPEPQVGKRFGIQRIKMLEDVARTLKQGDIINKVVYSRDGNYRPPKSDDYWPYDVEPCNDMNILKEVLSNGFESAMASAILQEPLSVEETTPIIQDACEFNFGGAAFTDPDFPASGCGYQENGSAFSTSESLLKSKPPLNFRSDFECGNLRTAIQVREFEYDLILDADCNTNHHHQWFYFEVSRISAGIPYRFNIVNCEKSSSQFNAGMQPLMYSVSEARLGNPCWRRAGSSLCYYKSHFSRSSASTGGVKGKTYFTMTFTVTFHHDKDICYFSYHYPYTHTQLNADLHKLVAQVDEKEVYVRAQTFCHTLGQNPVPVLTITAQPDFQQDKDNEEIITEFRSRPYIFLSARVHPGESNSSWTMRGTLKLLLSSKNSTGLSQKLLETADQLRKSYIFKVIPMLNPDGVINGHHRCSLTGEDLNRQWIDPEPTLFPTIYHAKGLLQYLHSIGKAPLVYCDYHGHSRRKNVFMYGCSRRESVIAGETEALCGAPDDTGYKTLPKLLTRMAPAFSMSNCSFVVERCKESTARVVVWKEMGVARSYTMESTYCGCDQGKYKGYQIGTYELEEMGMILCEALLQLKNKDRARRLPTHGLVLSEDDPMYTSLSDVSSSDLPSFDSETRQKNPEWNGMGEFFQPGSDCVVPCPTNSDEELTPDEVDSIGSFKAEDDRFSSENTLAGHYPREFWDYNEYCRGFGFGPEEEDFDATPRAGEDMTSSEKNELHHRHRRGDFVMTSSYRICPDTGAVMYEETDCTDAMLASIMERNSICEKQKPSKS